MANIAFKILIVGRVMWIAIDCQFPDGCAFDDVFIVVMAVATKTHLVVELTAAQRIAVIPLNISNETINLVR